MGTPIHLPRRKLYHRTHISSVNNGKRSPKKILWVAIVRFKLAMLTFTSKRLYLSSSLYNVCNTVLQNTLPPGNAQGPGRDAIFSTHLRILLDPTHPQPLPTWKRILKLARQYSVASRNPEIWIRRLEAEQIFVSRLSDATSFPPETPREISRLARGCCQGDGIESTWTWRWDELNAAQREVSGPTSLSSVAKGGVH
jgi:hypothetical protein